jgi:Alpha 1,4-glycosyltransferase conserved region/Glycosyltransferase sugar-binding region containing DXD motif
MTREQLPTIQMFWHGSPLSRMERLAIASFLRNGHAVDLYVYDEPDALPPGTRLRDAEEILPRSALFRHKRTQSLAAFADWFRYRLLFERGGIWADADIVCLKPFDYENAEIYAWQDERYINNAVLGLPAGHALAQWLADCCENPNEPLPYDDFAIRLRKMRRRVLKGDRREDVRWGENGPKGLTRAARHLGYADKALPSWHFYPVSPGNYRRLFETPANGSAIEFNGSRAVHLWNHLLEGQAGFDKNTRFAAESPFERLCARYLNGEA